MTLRRRFALAAAAAVAAAVALAAVISYVVVRDQLRSEVDSALSGQAGLVTQFGNLRLLGGPNLPGLPPDAGGRAPYAQVVLADGTPLPVPGTLALPTDDAARAVASGRTQSLISDLTVAGAHLRLLAVHATASSRFTGQTEPIAIELARPLGPVDRVLAHLRLILLVVFVGGVGLAAVLGRIAARRLVRPLAEVADTAQAIGETDDLSTRLAVRSDDEVGRLARRFNGMLERLEQSRAALDESVRAQRRLVADASHELRTPVTSLRTNVEVLLIGGELAPEERDRLLADVVEQSEELSSLVGDLIELARGDEPVAQTDDVRLDAVVAESLARARRNAPGLRFEGSLAAVTVEGVADRLERAVNNLLDNAARHSLPGGVVEVTVDSTGVTVRDHGRGLRDDELPHVFDRFFRGADARASTGSGLGLAIVKQVAEQHGGAVTAANADDGGAIFRIAIAGQLTHEHAASALPMPPAPATRTVAARPPGVRA